MGAIGELTQDVRIKLYGKRAMALRVSPDMIRLKMPNDCISVINMVKKSKSPRQFRDLANKELLMDRHTDYHDFSLLMGSYFGVYNLYRAEYVHKDVRKELLRENPSPAKTREFFEIYHDSIFSYMEQQYGFDSELYDMVLEKLFTVSYDSSIYYYDVPEFAIMGKIVMGNQLYLQDHSLPYGYVGASKAIDYFNYKSRGNYCQNKVDVSKR